MVYIQIYIQIDPLYLKNIITKRVKRKFYGNRSKNWYRVLWKGRGIFILNKERYPILEYDNDIVAKLNPEQKIINLKKHII